MDKTKICPRCGSINIGMSREAVTVNEVSDQCLDCGFNSNADAGKINAFPEVDMSEVAVVQKTIRENTEDENSN